ncbi:MAG: hypothetical protein JW763_01955 [candidate division Zixibacteria bacterium]|nr:hypothetical protein [candidate division Zixibacteria bacterium]
MDEKSTICRRTFMALSGTLGLGTVLGGVPSVLAQEVPSIEQQKFLVKWWLDTLLDNLDSAEKSGCLNAIEVCGRGCAQYFMGSHGQEAIAEIGDNKDLDQILAILNKHDFGGGNLIREGNSVIGTYDKCYCPIRSAGYTQTPVFCNCTKGFSKEFFERILGKTVEVELLKTIAAGDDVCQIKMTLV